MRKDPLSKAAGTKLGLHQHVVTIVVTWVINLVTKFN